MKTKILILLLAVFLTIGFVAATDVNNLKVPDGWEAIGGGSYHEEGASEGQGTGQNMIIQKWYDDLKDEYYNNISEDNYIVMDKGNNTYIYSDGLNQNAGSFEVVEIDGEKYFVNFWTADDMNPDEIAKTYDCMVTFNVLNGFSPVEV